ncbi:MAG: sensor domain-containing diguanylate cyclase, partial [Shewanella sp.]
IRFTDQGLRDYVSISASQGIASEVNGQFRTSLAMVCAADTALYRAKADGRDRINTSL